MRRFLFIASGLFAFFGLVICIANVSNTSGSSLLILNVGSSMFGPLFIMLMFGVITGFFLGLAINFSKKDNNNINDDLDL